MPLYYGICLKLRLKPEIRERREFVEKLIRMRHAEVRINSLIIEDDIAIINYVYMVGTEISNHKNLVKAENFYQQGDEHFEIVDLNEEFCIRNKMPNYMEYCAKKLHDGLKPMPPEEFKKRIKNGEYWEDL